MIRLAETDELHLDKELAITLTKSDLIQLFCAIGNMADDALQDEVAAHLGDNVALAISPEIDTFALYTDIKAILKREGMEFV